MKFKENYSSDDISKGLHEDWKQLVELATNNELVKGVLIEKNGSSGLNIFSLIIFATAILIWLFWRLM